MPPCLTVNIIMLHQTDAGSKSKESHYAALESMQEFILYKQMQSQ